MVHEDGGGPGRESQDGRRDQGDAVHGEEDIGRAIAALSRKERFGLFGLMVIVYIVTVASGLTVAYLFMSI